MGDALFLKDPAQVIQSFARPWTALTKLAISGLLYFQFEYAMECLEVARQNGLAPERLPKEAPRYQQLLLRILQESTQDYPLYLPTFDELYSFEESAARFARNTATEDLTKIPVEAARRRYFSGKAFEPWLAALEQALSDQPHSLERVFRDFGMRISADLARDRRREHARAILSLLGFTRGDDCRPDLDALKNYLATLPDPARA